VIAKLRKRRFYPVEIDGEKIHLRALLDSEHKEVEPISQDVESFGYAIGCCLISDTWLLLDTLGGLGAEGGSVLLNGLFGLGAPPPPPPPEPPCLFAYCSF
jgi:hypothetical protein